MRINATLITLSKLVFFFPFYLVSADVNALQILSYKRYYQEFPNFNRIENPTGSANAIYNRATLQIDSSSLRFGDVSASQKASGINLSYLNKIAFSGGSIHIGNITSTQNDAYGIKSTGKGLFRLYHGLFAFVDASININSISGAKNAYGMHSTQELDILGSGNLNRGVITFRGTIEAGNEVYGVNSPILKLKGTNLKFSNTLSAQRNAYGIKSEKELLIQESDTYFAPIISRNANAYGIAIKDKLALQNSEMSQDISLLHFSSISAPKGNAYGIYQNANSQNPTFLIRNTRLIFDSISSSNASYGFYNQGATYQITNNFFNPSGAFINFKSIESLGESIGIYNMQGSSNAINLLQGKISFLNIKGGVRAYGIKSATPFAITLKKSGERVEKPTLTIEFKNIISDGDAYGLYAENHDTKIDLMDSGSLAFENIIGKNTYGIYAKNASVQINLNHSTLSFSLRGTNQKVFAKEGSGRINIAIEDNARMIVDGDGGVVDALTLKQRLGFSKQTFLIDLSGFSSQTLQSRKQARTLEIAQYENSGNYVMISNLNVGLFVDPSKGYSDKIIIKSASNTGYADNHLNLQVFYNSQTMQTIANIPQKLVLAEIDPKIKVNGISKIGDSGISQTDIGFDRIQTTIHSSKDSGTLNQYFINTDEKPIFKLNPNLAFNSFGALTNQYNLHFFNLGEISRRLGTLRKGYDDGGMWGRMSAGRSAFGQGGSLSAFNIELGGDYGILKGNDLNIYIGGNFTYTTSFLSTEKDDAQGMEVGLYGGIMAQKWYYYGQIKGEYFSSRIFLPSIHSFQITQGIVTLSQELGYRFGEEKGGFYFEPKTQLDLSLSLPISYTQTDTAFLTTLQTRLDSNIFLGGKIGGDIGYNFVRSNLLKSDLYFGIFYDYQFFKQQNLHFKNPKYYECISLQNRFYHGVLLTLGSHIEASKHIKLSLDVDFGFGNGFFNIAKGNFGFKYVF